MNATFQAKSQKESWRPSPKNCWGSEHWRLHARFAVLALALEAAWTARRTCT